MKFIKLSEILFIIVFLLFYYWLFTLGNDGIYIALTVLLIPTIIHVIQICDEENETSKIWKPLFISYSGLIILLVLISIKIKEWKIKKYK